MPAPAPVAAADSVKLIRTSRKPKPGAAPRAQEAQRDDDADAPRFDDALKHARAKPRDGAEAREEKRATQVQRPTKPKASQEMVEPPASPAPETAGAADDAPSLRTETPAVEQVPTIDVKLEQDRPVTAPPDVEMQSPAAAVVVAPAQSTQVSDGAPLATVEVDQPALSAVEALAVQAPHEAGEDTGAGGGGETKERVAASVSQLAGVESGADVESTPPPEEEPEGSAPVAGVAAHRVSRVAAAAVTRSDATDTAPGTTPAPVDADAADGTVSAEQPPPQEQQPRQSIDAGAAEASADATAAKSASGVGQHTTASTDPSSMVAASVKASAPAPADPAPAPAPAAPAAPTAREVEFAQANHDRLVTAMRAQLVPRGGTMQIRLDPPELGSLQVAVQMLDGVMSVSFETSNDQATQLLSHSLAQLKHVLESHGVAVDKLHVQQAPRSEPSSNNSNDPDQQQHRHGAHDENLARQEQQRKEMLRRMWRRLGLGNDPLDLVA